MSFPRYERYKDSGVEWLGAVPTHWPLFKLKRIATFSGGGTPSRDNLSYWNGEIPWISPKDMKSEQISSAEESITEAGLLSSATNLLPAGKLLMVVRSGILKYTIPVAINQVPVALNQDMKALSFRRTECLTEFFLRWVQGLNDQLLLAWSKQGATVESIEHKYLADTLIALPPFAEQSAIVGFLNRETAKIDALVDEQKRLIELLKEKRQAVTSHAVTKGLNPNAPMKHSGIEGIGEVPRHWDLKRMKHVSHQITVGIVVEPSKHYCDEDDGVPALRSLNVRAGKISLENVVYISTQSNELLSKSKLHVGDVVAVRTGQPGTAAVIPQELDGCNCIDLIIIRKPTNGCEEFLCWYLASDAAIQQFGEGSEGAIQQHFNISTASNLLVSWPPTVEQKEIANFLSIKTGEIDALLGEAESAIALLQERRCALISAAVTGKIDVRDLARPKAEAA
jgi:type I restriction enzyme S subunit